MSVSSSINQEFVRTSKARVRITRVGSGAPLVLLHTNGHSWHEFAPVLDDLATEHELIIWDMVGQGDSDPVPADFSIDDHTDVLVEVLDALDVGPATIVGCSVGAFIAAALAVRAPERVRAVGLVELQFRELGFWASDQMWSLVEQSFAIPTQAREQVQPRFESQLSDEALVRWNIDRNKAGTRSLLGVMWAIREYDIQAVVPRITQPVLALFGTAGPTAPSEANARDWLPEHAEVVVIDGAGHFLTADQPARFVEEILRLARSDA